MTCDAAHRCIEHLHHAPASTASAWVICAAAILLPAATVALFAVGAILTTRGANTDA